MNVGVSGLFILAYYNLIGALPSTARDDGHHFLYAGHLHSGSHPGKRLGRSCWDTCWRPSWRADCQDWRGQFTFVINAQAIAVGSVRCQQPESHYQQVRLVLGHGCGRDGNYFPVTSVPTPRRVLPV